MSFGRATEFQERSSNALMEYSIATDRYKKACQEITKQRLSLDRPDATDAELAQYMRARTKYKAECRLYNEARIAYISFIRHVPMRVQNPTDAELFALACETNQAVIRQRIKEEAIARTISPEDMEVVRTVMEARRHQPPAASSSIFNMDATAETSDVGVGSKAVRDDPTCGDFEPLA